MTHLSISLLGGLHLSLDEAPLPGFVSRKADALLAYLACQPRPFPRDTLAALLWPDNDQNRALANLSVVLSSLRKQLDAYLLADRHTIAFNTAAPHTLDVHTVENAIAQARDQQQKTGRVSRTVAAQLDTAVSHYHGPFLAGFHLRGVPDFEAWVLLEQERLQQLALAALADLAAFSLDRRQSAAGIAYAQQLLALDPLQESAHRQLMRLYVQDNQRPAALAQYETCTRILDEELGVPPAEETTALYEQIAGEQGSRGAGERGGSGAEETAPPLPRSPAPHLLTPTTPFLGRETELARIAAWLADPHARLLTILGPGGVGKTRLAQEAARACRGQFADGVWYVSLAAVTRSGSLETAVAEAIHMPQTKSSSLHAQLRAYLRHKEMLLILDNLEHILTDESVALLTSLLADAPELNILATSRERLNVQAETLLELQGLPYSDALDAAPAVQLFAARAARHQPGFTLAGHETAVLDLCRLVDGLPLALELAAAWTRTLAPADIVAEIRRDAAALAATLRDLPTRHRSIHAVFDTSWALLTPPEQAVMRQLSVFAGRFDRAFARDVAGAALPQLQALLDKSMLQRSDDAFDLHPLLKQLAAARLAADSAEQAAARRRHAHAVRDRLLHWGGHMRRAGQRDALAAVAALLEDVALAWQWAAAAGELDVILQPLPGLIDYFQNGRHLDGIPLLENALQQLAHTAAAGRHPLAVARLQLRLAGLLVNTPDLARADRLLDDSLATFRAHDAPLDVAAVLRARERVEHARGGALSRRRQLLNEALALHRAAGSPEGAGLILYQLGILAQLEGSYDEAVSLAREMIALAEASGDLSDLAYAHFGCGAALRDSGQYAAARPHYERCLEITRILDDRYLLAYVLNHLAGVHALLDQREDARRLYAECRALSADIGEMRNVGYTLVDWGEAEFIWGSPAESRRLQAEGLRLLQEVGDQWGIAGAYLNLGDLEAQENRWPAARAHYARALAAARLADTVPMAHHALAGLAQYLLRLGQAPTAVFLVAYLTRQSAVTGPIKQLAAELWTELQPPDPAAREALLTKAGSTTLDDLLARLPPAILNPAEETGHG